jgi:hypothetical protein
MYKGMSLIVLMLSIIQGNSQTYSEWFRQARTQKKYLLQQIASYQIYSDYISKGYSIIEKGNKFIGTIKFEDYKQHKDHIQSLYAVSGNIRNSQKVAGILWMGEQIIPLSEQSIRQANTTALLSTTESVYVQSVFRNLLQHCQGALDELSLVITPGKLQLTDDERLDCINRLYADMQVKFTFAVSFSKAAGIFRLQRSKEKTGVGQMKKLNGLP